MLEVPAGYSLMVPGVRLGEVRGLPDIAASLAISRSPVVSPI